ncbi:MAG: DUF3362 domain-containing protein, partial [Eubacteriales bacterium]
NFRHPACERQKTEGVCANRKCLAPSPCKNLIADHSEYIELLDRIQAVKGVKKVFIRSGIRFDYMLCDKNEEFFKKLVRDHVSGQLKVAPEHCSDRVLSLMGKPKISVFERFRSRFFELTKSFGKEQYLVPYLMSSHPGSELSDAVELALYLKRGGWSPEQVQDFYPTPGTASTVMFYTGIDPLNGKNVRVVTDYHEKQLQRALLQFGRPDNAPLVREALTECGRTDLIGFGGDCLVKPERGAGNNSRGGAKSFGENNTRGGNSRGGAKSFGENNTRGGNSRGGAKSFGENNTHGGNSRGGAKSFGENNTRGGEKTSGGDRSKNNFQAPKPNTGKPENEEKYYRGKKRGWAKPSDKKNKPNAAKKRGN